jgi:hypothetical protein
MILKGAQISLNNKMIDEDLLAGDRKRWHRKAISIMMGFLPDKEKEDHCKELLLRGLLYDLSPLCITGDQLILRAEIKEYPYSINDKKNYRNFSVALIVESGLVTCIELDKSASTAINYLAFFNEKIVADFGNGSLHFELFFNSDASPSLGPPLGFKEKYNLMDDDTDD